MWPLTPNGTFLPNPAVPTGCGGAVPPPYHRSNACGRPADAARTALPTRINVAFSAMLALISLAALVLKLR